MSEMRPIRPGGSLLERAAAVYDFQAEFRAVGPAAKITPAPLPLPVANTAPPPIAETRPAVPAASPEAPIARRATGPGVIDRNLLAVQGLLVPGAPVGVLAEEFRLVKRQLLLTARTVKATQGDRSRTVLVCSANPNEGKTYCSLNLALSLAAERDTEVLLVDADFAKPDVMARLGLIEGQGLLDALANPAIDIEACVVHTDIPQLSLLPAGTKSNQDTELLASARTSVLIQQLLDANPRRIVIFDSPPALAASPAATLAQHVGQVMLVVRADQTSEGDLRDAVGLLAGCTEIQLVLNAVSYAPGGRRFGSYYGLEEPK
ncbi:MULTISPECIES: AAA family ATPase [unclassified Sphingomonas]|uniref:AAA family ATPase n=1 Tax=unclassified Sphingomonas TaxID=196159 RepID=UPI000BD1990E|nr:MAG: exopolysaccharide biosynthesis protein [Sphingomonas sp. 32-62-10]